jgi:hypothetical protein
MPLCMLCALCFASVHIYYLAMLKVHLCWITQRARDVLLVPLWVPGWWTMYVCDHVCGGKPPRLYGSLCLALRIINDVLGCTHQYCSACLCVDKGREGLFLNCCGWPYSPSLLWLGVLTFIKFA